MASLRSLARICLATLVGVVTLLVAGSPAESRTGDRGAAPPAARAGFVKHSGPNWVWFGPKKWVAVYGTYGITVSSANGRTTLDLGFSSILCAPGQDWNQSVTNYFASQRQALQNNGVTITGASAIVHPSGMAPMYRRQVVKVATGGKQGVKGKVVLDYDFTTTVDTVNYCYQRSIGLSAPKKRWGADKKTLAKVWASLAYSGPGAYEDDE